MADQATGKAVGQRKVRPYKKSHSSCLQCRHDKQKCSMQDGNDSTPRQACDRCERLGHQCQFSDAKAWTPPKHSNLLLPKKDGMGNHYSCFPLNPAATEYVPESQSAKFLRPRTVAGQPAQLPDLRSPRYSNPDEEHGPSTKADVAPPSQNGRREWNVRSLLKLLGDLKGLRTNLLVDLRTGNALERKLGPNKRIKIIRLSISRMLDAVDGDAKIHFRQAWATMSENSSGYREEPLLIRLLALTADFQSRCLAICETYEHEQYLTNDISRIQVQVQNALSQVTEKKKQPFSIIESVCSGIGLPGSLCRTAIGKDFDHKAAMCERAADDIRANMERLLSKEPRNESRLLSDELNGWSLRKGYPAPHLAYRRGDRSVAVTMCTTSPTYRYAIDLLHRTIVHHACYANDLQTMIDLISIDPYIIRKSGADMLGMTPLSIAAKHNNVEMFHTLVNAGAAWNILDSEHRSLLGIAARSGSLEIVQLIIRQRQFSDLSGPTNDLSQAIEGGREDIAKLILTILREPDYFDASGLEQAAQIADLRNLHQLADSIRAIKPLYGSSAKTQLVLNAINSQPMSSFANGSAPSQAAGDPMSMTPQIPPSETFAFTTQSVHSSSTSFGTAQHPYNNQLNSNPTSYAPTFCDLNLHNGMEWNFQSGQQPGS